MNAKQLCFCQEYLLDMNATQACIRAGYSKKTAHSCGPRLLENAGVKAKISELMAAREKVTGYNAEYVLRRLGAELDADDNELFNEDGSMKPRAEWPLHWRQGLIAGYEVDRITGLTKIKLSDRVRRLELLGKHVGVQAFKDKVALEGELTLGQLLDAVKEIEGEDA